MLLARHIMTKGPLTVEPSASIAKSIRLLLERNGDFLVVLGDAGHPMGTVTESALLSAAIDGQRLHDPVCLHMSRPVVTIDSRAPLDSVIDQFILHRVRHLPVVEEGRLVGLITRRAVLATLVVQPEQPSQSAAWASA